MSSALNGRSTLQRFKRGNMVKISNRIIIYLGLPRFILSAREKMVTFIVGNTSISSTILKFHKHIHPYLKQNLLTV